MKLKLFLNEPAVDFTQAGEVDNFKKAIEFVKTQLGKDYPLFINGKSVVGSRTLESLNPNKPSEVIGHVSIAERSHIDEAFVAAKNAFSVWRNIDVENRASCLLKAAEIIRSRKYEFCAWQILEVGKQWEEAYGEVAEAIDFLEYYAREALHLGQSRHILSMAGEENFYGYGPRGVALVIAPWNFPLAISIGMVAAALVTGNTVVYKPSELSPVVGYLLVDIFREVGLDAGIFNYISGYGFEIGDYLVDNKDVSLISFTGSMQTGLHIIEKASKVHPHQRHVKRVICEMGGKNAIIVDADADLDQAIPAIIASAFRYQGQKCSACSRLIVLDEIYDRVIDRIVKAVKTLSIGPSEDPQYFLGAVIDPRAQEKVLAYQNIAQTEGEVLFKSELPQGEGYYVPLMIVGGINPEHRLAQEEVFGPLLAVMRVKDFDQALDWANSTRYGLTGGVFSRSPKNLDRARKEFRVGNLYLNRSITGACVGRQPFGGSYMSGTGTKAGGPDYLLNFVDPCVVTENTMRRGFVPEV